PLIALVFMAAALSLSGLPPFSGFVAKLTLVIGAVEAGQWAAAAIAIMVSLITLMSMLKIWGGVFWGTPPEPEHLPDQSETSEGPVRTVTRTRAPAQERVRTALGVRGLVLALTTLCICLGAQVLLELNAKAAQELMATSTHVEAVLRR